MGPEPVVPDRRDLDAAIRRSAPDVDLTLARMTLATMRLTRLVEAAMPAVLRPPGLDPAQHGVLLALWLTGDEEGLPVKELVGMVVQTSSGMTKTVHRLQQQGLVTRTVDVTDRRSRIVRMTPTGRELVEANFRRTVGFFEGLVSDRADADRRRLTAGIRDLVAALEAAAGMDQFPPAQAPRETPVPADTRPRGAGSRNGDGR